MNKKQEKIAIKLISTIKENDGLMTAKEINEHSIGKLFDFKTDIVVINGLVELGLIDNSKKYVFRLTDKGLKFKSFSKIRINKSIKRIKKNILYFLNIILIIVTIYLTSMNIYLSKQNTILTKDISELKEGLLLLDIRMDSFLDEKTQQENKVKKK
ncbi:MAG: hypothetical protein QM478_09560 [Flavobacteriaceae bacterium]